MADIADGPVQPGVRRLIVAGDETSGAVVDRLGVPGFLVGAEIAAGVPVLRAAGAGKGEMLLAQKSGNFGGTEFFSDALKLMRGSFYAVRFMVKAVAYRNLTGRQINTT